MKKTIPFLLIFIFLFSFLTLGVLAAGNETPYNEAINEEIEVDAITTATPEVTEVETTIEDTTAPETTRVVTTIAITTVTPETDPVTTDEVTETAAEATTVENSKGGCGSAVEFGFMTVLFPVALFLRKKNI